MGYSTSTPNLQLPQWEDDDKPTWLGDVNLAFKKVDDSYGNLRGDISTLQARVTALEARVQALEGTMNLRRSVG